MCVRVCACVCAFSYFPSFNFFNFLKGLKHEREICHVSIIFSPGKESHRKESNG